LDSRPRIEVETHAEDTLEISSLFSKKPLTFKGTLNHAPIRILIDSGAMGNFVSKQAADRFSFALSDVLWSYVYEMAQSFDFYASTCTKRSYKRKQDPSDDLSDPLCTI